MSRKGLNSLKDPEVLEDVMFLVELKRPNHEIAQRCNVGEYALRKLIGARRDVV